MVDFYRIMYKFRYLTKQYIYDAAYWGVITPTDYEDITGEEYIA